MMSTPYIWRRFRELYVSRHEPEYVRPLAEIVWRSLLICIFISLVCIIIFAATVFWSVIDTLTAPAAAVKPPVALNRGSLENMLGQISDRQNRFDVLKTKPSSVVDPSK